MTKEKVVLILYQVKDDISKDLNSHSPRRKYMAQRKIEAIDIAISSLKEDTHD